MKIFGNYKKKKIVINKTGGQIDFDNSDVKFEKGFWFPSPNDYFSIKDLERKKKYKERKKKINTIFK